MIIDLVKKDFLLIKRYWPLIVILAFGIPLFCLSQLPSLDSFTAFMITVVYTTYIPLQSVSLAETKYPKTTALLCTTPYTRGSIVKARYLFFLILFGFCCIAYAILSLIVTQIERLNLYDLIYSLLLFSIIFGIYLPFQYKLGFEKMKYVLMVVILATSFLLPSIIIAAAKSGIGFTIFSDWLLPIRYAVLLAVIFLVVTISLSVSIKIFKVREL